MKHKWHDEIVAWAGGQKVEEYKMGAWFDTEYPDFNDTGLIFRIKPQPKEEKYLHIILQPNGSILLRTHPVFCGEEEYFGKIEVQDD